MSEHPDTQGMSVEQLEQEVRVHLLERSLLRWQVHQMERAKCNEVVLNLHDLRAFARKELAEWDAVDTAALSSKMGGA